jgi:hypothetical protein
VISGPESPCRHHPQRVGLERDPHGRASADLAVDVEREGRLGLQPHLAGREEPGAGQRPAGPEDRLVDGREAQPEPVGVAEPVHHQLAVVEAGVGGDRPAGVVTAVGDVELVGGEFVDLVADAQARGEGPVAGQ